MADRALQEANQSFTSNDDNALFRFGQVETFANPTYQFNSQRGDIDYGAGTLLDMLTALNDPREGVIIDPNYGDVNGVGIGSYFGDINGAVEFITYDEILFIKAEATLRSTGNYADAEAFYQEGITQNMAKLGVSTTATADYVAAQGTLPTTDVTAAVAQVAAQEFIALYLNPEAWTLWRRTGSPALTPTAGSNGVPRRFLYPQNEYSLNASNVPQSTTLFSNNVFWDK